MPALTRRHTVTALVGGVPVGSGHPIVVQSMTNTDTADADATAIQVARLAHAGSQFVRVTVNTEAAAAAVPEMVSKVRGLGVDVPIVGDFHYNGHKLLVEYPAMAAALAKYRINPGNVGAKRHDEHFATIIRVAIENDVPVRIGVNWGSLDQAILTELMDANAKGETKFITRNGRTESVLMSVSEYEYLTELTGPDWHPNQLRRALEDIEQGNVFSEEESRTMMKQVMARARGKREATKTRHHK